MEDQDKISEQFKNVFQKQGAPPFDAMDKIWNRVEEKLDKKVLRKENKLWKKIAVAASILLFLTLGYQFLNTDQTKINANPESNEQVVVTDSTSILLTSPENGIVESAAERNPMIKRDVQAILDKQITNADQVATTESDQSHKPEPLKEFVIVKPTVSQTAVKDEQSAKLQESKNESDHAIEMAIDKKAGDAQSARSQPLVIVDGKAAKNRSMDDKGNLELNVDPNDVEELVVLNEPLYIINGVHYSEPELFGPNPTSPYAPLNQQEIESISVLQGTKAIESYGEKGRKGVVIIITKSGKPAKAAKGK